MIMMHSKILVYEIILRYVLCILCSNLFCISSLLTYFLDYFPFPILEFYVLHILKGIVLPMALIYYVDYHYIYVQTSPKKGFDIFFLCEK